MFDVDRVKVTNGMHPSSTFQSDTQTQSKGNGDHTDDSDDFENTRLLNILNWSPLEDLVTNKAIPVLDENESRSKNSYNAVQISIELQKKMLK